MAQRETSTLQRNIYADRWFRFEGYEIKGDYICPIADAKLVEIFPWQEFRNPAGKKSVRQPYHSLLELASHLRWDSRLRLEGDGEQRVLDWCGEHGLLGLLLHRVETVILPAEKRFTPGVSASAPTPKTTIFERRNRGWTVIDAVDLPTAPTKPGVYIRRQLGGFQMTFEPLEKTWGSFFRDVPVRDRPGYQYPAPFTPDFWRQYCEPLGQFVAAAVSFRQAVDTLRKLGARTKPAPAEIMRAESLMHALSLPVRPLLYQHGKHYGVGWACHSLLAAYAMMAILDLARARVLECANPTCRKIFVSNTVQARYCGETCRGTVQVRKRRKLQEKALRLAAAGLSCEEIAGKLRKDRALVVQWAEKWRSDLGLSVPLVRKSVLPLAFVRE